MHPIWLQTFLSFIINYKDNQNHALTAPKDQALRLSQKIMLNSAEHEFFPAHECWNANNFNIYEQEK